MSATDKETANSPGAQQNKVISDCMDDPKMISQFPDAPARMRACYRQAQLGPMGPDVARAEKAKG